MVVTMMVLTGCGKDNETPNNENNNNNQQEQQGGNNQQDNENIDMKLYSDDTKIVFDTTAYKLVFYYSGNDITGYEMYYDFGSIEMATYGKKSIENNLGEDSDVLDIKQNGQYIIVKFAESEYEDLTVEGVRAAYSTLQEVKKSN